MVYGEHQVNGVGHSFSATFSPLTSMPGSEILRSRAESLFLNSQMERSATEKGSPMDAATRALWLALMIFFSLAVGVAAGVLAANGNTLPVAVLTGGGSFGGTLLLLLAVFHFATADSRTRK
jgi:hypothetical protein